jgi:hypothetical protein
MMSEPTDDAAGMNGMNGMAEIDEQEAADLLDRLGLALRAEDPVPERVLAGARVAFTWRTIDAELAELVFDSATELTGVRGGVEDTARQVTFQAPGVEIEVMVIDDGSRRIVGQLVPPRDVTVQLTTADAVRDTRTDAVGRFTFQDVASGPVRLSVLGDGDEGVIHTEWVLL